MHRLSYKDMMYLKEIGLYSYGYAYILRYLLEDEYEGIKKINDIKEQVERVLEILNNKKQLPQEYKHLVNNYNEFCGVLIPKEEIMCDF